MCHTTNTRQLQLEVTNQASAHARRFIEETSCIEHNTAVLDEAKLLVSELVSNAVTQGYPPVILRVECHDEDGLKVSVHDGSPENIAPRKADPLDESGRGLMLVALLSDDWGVDLASESKDVWFTLREKKVEAFA